VVSIAFPFILAIGGFLYAGLALQDSMSAYYHAQNGGQSMRDWFVGILFAIGVFLYLYRGYSQKENLLLNAAGVLALGIALFPMEWRCGATCHTITAHGICALGFFVCIAYVCAKCSTETLCLLADEQQRVRFQRIYQLLAFVMLASPVIAFLLNTLTRQAQSLVFYIEATGIFAFSAYWLVKSHELSITQADVKALSGEMQATLVAKGLRQ
jgi:hypothetical protein